MPRGGIHHAAQDEDRYYAASWLLVHYLMNQRHEDFKSFQRRLARMEEPQAAWNATFPEWSLQTPGSTLALEARATGSWSWEKRARQRGSPARRWPSRRTSPRPWGCSGSPRPGSATLQGRREAYLRQFGVAPEEAGALSGLASAQLASRTSSRRPRPLCGRFSPSPRSLPGPGRS